MKRKFDPVVLEEHEAKKQIDFRDSVWKEIVDARAADVINDHELGLLASDEGLQLELRGENSLARVLGINLDTYFGLMREGKDYAPQHYSTVDHYIKGAQAAYKLGRVMSLESCMAPLSVGGDCDELPPGVKLEHEEQKRISLPITREEAREAGYGLAMRALVARARVSDELCQWYAYAPLYTVMLFRRPGRDEKPIKPTTENTSR